MAYRIVITPPSKHRLDIFVILFRIDENTVIIDGMFHELQDYEAIFVNELNL